MSRELCDHFVGSYPADASEEAMREMLAIGGEYLPRLSDGETGDRQNWVVSQIDSYADNPAFNLVKPGSWTSYEDCPEFAVAEGHELTPDDFNLAYHANAKNAWPIFERIRHDYRRPDLKFQVGVPHSLDMSLFTFGMERGLAAGLIETYTQATLQQIEAIRNEPFGDDVVFQIETPASLSLSLFPQDQLPPQLRPAALGKSIAQLCARAPENSMFGVHLCLGDLGNEARGQLQDRMPAVALMNAIAEAWPHTQKLDYIHEPIAAGSKPPIMDPAVYASLDQLHLPAEAWYIAGLIHEDASLSDQRQILRWIRAAVPEEQKIGIAAACGLGRREREIAQLMSRRMVQLIEDL